jgi:hypothetical protein
MSESTTIERLVTGGTSPVGAALAAFSDAHGVGVPLGRGRSIPLSTVGTVIGIGTGLMLGKGGLAAAAFGFGMGQLDGFVYKAVTEFLASHASAESDDDDD